MSDTVPPVASVQVPATVPLAYATVGGPYALYSSQAVGLATFLGSPVAGAVIMAINYRRLGQRAAANKAILVGVFSTALLFGLAFLPRLQGVMLFISIAATLTAAKMARTLQGTAFDGHKSAGGRVASMWKAAGVGLLCGVAAFVVALAIVMLFSLPAIMSAMHPSPALQVGNGQIRYSGSATQGDAQALGNALTNAGYFRGPNQATVFLSKDGSGTTLSFVIKRAADSDHTLDVFTTIADTVAPAIGGRPFTFKLLSPELDELRVKKLE